MSGGHCGKILRVDLTNGTITKEPLPPQDILCKYVGGSTLGLYYLMQSLTPGIKALDPETPLVLMTGPLTGTRMPNASDWAVVTLNAQIPFAPSISHIHGFFGARMKHAGYDGIVFQGKSPKPVFLFIDDDKVELRDAEKYWGMDTIETPQTIQKDIGMADDPNTSIACIGPAGEELMRGAVVRADMAYVAAKGGPGSIWGSKNLKAISVRGTRPVQIHDPELFVAAAEDLRNRAEGRHEAADVINVQPAIADEGAVAGKNFTDTKWQLQWAERWREEVGKWKYEGVGSWECLFKCHHDTTVTTGPYAGTRITGYGAGVIEEAATIIGIEDPGTCMFMAAFYDAMGCDPSEEGRLIAMCYELYEEGLLTEEQTGGLKLEWGNDEAARDLFMQILMREEPLGRILAKGYKAAIEELPIIKDRFMHIKDSGFMHDLRGYGLGVLFQSIVSGAGTQWQGFGVEKWSEPDLGYHKPMDPAVIEGKAEATFKTQCLKMVEDSVGLCWFVVIYHEEGKPGITKVIADAVSAATGWDFSWAKARDVGDRAIQMQRLIAISRGFKKTDDLNVAPRLLEAPKNGPAAGRALGPHLESMLDEYYALCGWDVETGIPLPETIERLGLSIVSNELGHVKT